MKSLVAAVQLVDPIQISGRVAAVQGMMIVARGAMSYLSIGARVEIDRHNHSPLAGEVVGFSEDRVLLMPFGSVEGVTPGAEIRLISRGGVIAPSLHWRGRIIDAFGDPIDGKGSLPKGLVPYSLKAAPPQAHVRNRIGPRIDLKVRALDVFTSCCQGQRLGIFAGSGVGKSVLLSMLAKQAQCDVVVVGLIGERGREVREFIEETLGEEGLKRAVVVVATSDLPALVRRQAAYTTMAVAEYFRDQGQEVLCLMDSVTRFAMAQREIGLATGEPPTSKGYTPTVFSELPKLLERAGPGPMRPDGTFAAAITAFFTVLVDGDDHNEPIADAVRGILDGHIVMERAIAERGRFPAIHVLKSISRTMPNCQTLFEQEVVRQARRYLAAFADMEDLIRIGAYRRGSDPVIDQAIALNPGLENFLSQLPNEVSTSEAAFQDLHNLLNEGLAS